MSRSFSRRRLLRGSAAVIGAGVVGAALPTTAAASDFYNPFSGSLGGIDYPLSVGTNLPACGGGTVTNTPELGTGGHTVTIAHPNGYRTQYMHLSQFVLGNGTRVSAGDNVGLSGGAKGAPGSGNSTGPHLHWHMINPAGVRINPLVYLDGGGGGGLPKTATEQDGVPGPIFWMRVQNWVRIDAGYTGPVDGVPGPNTYAGMQRYLASHHGYTGPVDGVPGPNTYSALQRLASHHGYTGPVDGVMGPQSWRGVARFVNRDRFD